MSGSEMAGPARAETEAAFAALNERRAPRPRRVRGPAGRRYAGRRFSSAGR